MPTKDRFAGAMPAGATSEELQSTFCGKNVLFYIERSNNSNAVIYEANVGADGKLVTEEPVKVYWILYARKPIVEEGLTMIERNTAYGSKTSPLPAKGEGHFEIALSALPEKKIHVYQDEAGELHATTEIEGSEKELLHVFVENTSFMGIPKVKHIDIKGRSPDGNLSVERKMA
ncbi:Hypothetical Protein FCC1311_045842 [Hondaea fermentalgiana]|uniref:DUF4833 domain-containing protein n=1 Tax=Hondaea fermentalgiana TaxID=2315210 RepID=A0A2R5GJ93_9STRA|nr:Hypothetical Protein FCC1311_045842 [Hondaea fermentalgiana]|eukprot:GBG28361.1 Hypothetical Protein FCC1311_045842 [Hondaea fermentalgiana]